MPAQPGADKLEGALENTLLCLSGLSRKAAVRRLDGGGSERPGSVILKTTPVQAEQNVGEPENIRGHVSGPSVQGPRPLRATPSYSVRQPEPPPYIKPAPSVRQASAPHVFCTAPHAYSTQRPTRGRVSALAQNSKRP